MQLSSASHHYEIPYDPEVYRALSTLGYERLSVERWRQISIPDAVRRAIEEECMSMSDLLARGASEEEMDRQRCALLSLVSYRVVRDCFSAFPKKLQGFIQLRESNRFIRCEISREAGLWR